MNKCITIIVLIILINQLSIAEADAHQSSKTPNIVSESALLIDEKTGQVLYEKYPDNEMYPASLTKIATAIYAIETGDLDDIVTVSRKARSTGGSSVFLDEGEQLSLRRLVEGLIINSGNDTGVAIAEHLEGSVMNFSDSLNKYLKNTIGVNNTNFENPHGLFDPAHVTTATDLAKITQYAMKNKVFRDIIGTKQLNWNGESWDTTLYTHHKLMREQPYEGITGGKTGYVTESGFTLITTAQRNNISLIAVVLKAPQVDAYNDTTKLLDYGFDNFKTNKIEQGKEYTDEEGIVYEIQDDLYFTQSVGEQVKPKLSSDGKLTINQKSDDLNVTFKLSKKVEDEEKDKQTNKVDQKIVEESEQESGTFLIVFVIVIVAVFFSLRIRKKILLNR
ncbi:D-alanyl-D-alanine carboxypeptidase family protein [Aquibacillus saliphilus]|uniref:D-alanyl-D-alanine carboxypeptidase family protein n=1 Tax=Aquibacillus saliphilus TaxID=1909422 RepID=UPI001CEFFFFC|nr:D-alanyl-D-alanine carboxypeptidase family protein [Aquibacillus saliphilus]